MYPLFFYEVGFKKDNNLKLGDVFVAVVILTLIYIAQVGLAVLNQIFAIISVPVLFISKKYDHKVRLPRSFFYPLHLTVFLLIDIIL